MAGRSDIEAGKAHILLYLKNQLGRGLNMVAGQLQGVGSQVMRVGGALTGLGVGLVTPLIAAVGVFSSMGSELADLSARTGVAVGTLAELKFAAEQTGASLADVEKGIIQQQRKGLGSDFAAVARSIAAIEDPAKRTEAAFEAWGKSGVKLIPMIENLAALRQEARDLGLVPTDQAVAMADEIGDAVDKIKSVLAATVFEVGAALAPMLLPALETVKNIAAWFNRWAKTNGEIIRTVAMVAGGVLAAGVAVTFLGASIFAVGSLFGLAASAVAALGAAVGFLTSPVTLVVAAIVGGIAAWAAFTASGQAAVKAIVDFFLPMIETIRTAVGGIGDALMAGDLELAGRIAVKALQVVFAQGVAQIAAMIGGTLGALIGTIGTQLIAGDLAGAWDTAVKGMAAVWDQFMLGILAAFKSAADAILAIWTGVTVAIDASIVGIRSFLLKHGGQAGAVASAALGGVQQGLGQVAAPVGTALSITSAAAGITSAKQGQQAAKSTADFAAAIAGGAGEASDKAAELAAELEELRRQAAAAREEALAGPKAAAPEVDPAAIEKAAATVTFSGAALAAAGQGGGGPAQRQLKAAEDGNRKLDVIHQDIVKLTEKMTVPVAA